MARPLNCYDTELHPDITRLPVTQPAWTEIIFSLIMFDIAYTWRFIESDQPWPSKIQAVQNCQRRL
ncbi:hypothetical protein ASPBRDRAFT_669508 [Aspergillus brasiliensis CBS 101740]|uniref:Uncharacterized protein n=1 Tax=Aspergillus brasiliensis (strain CBS 101740 / IMI 381727 / IBT 21946) TaxID=767769 RepID=A0A1L9U288_ASPBC|nr:hypothetical protein ASPBRDRAFT_669508 [Aspergillus brasiliensis CBS 101740]